MHLYEIYLLRMFRGGEYFTRAWSDGCRLYANGEGNNQHELINQTGHAETVHDTMMPSKFSQGNLLHYYFIINPTSKKTNKEMMWEPISLEVYYTDDKDLK